mmetsp:Transcript_9351/g.21692  ORF Transcript_9351/g.21692 Transcript_9351/m.21692 type:complete len:368 (-) Transcript_9351:23-1126(-)
MLSRWAPRSSGPSWARMLQTLKASTTESSVWNAKAGAYEAYFSRLPKGSKPKLLPRDDPVIWTKGADRTKGPLNQEQLAFFEENGFVVVPGLLSPAEVEHTRNRMTKLREHWEKELIEGRVVISGDQPVVTESGTNLLKSIWEVHKDDSPHLLDHAKFLNRLVRHPNLLRSAEQIVGKDVYIHQSRINYQPRYHGSGFSWHQDFEQWHSEDGMPRPRCVSCSIMLDKNLSENASTMMVPRSHNHFMQLVFTTPPKLWEIALGPDAGKRSGPPVNHEHMEYLLKDYNVATMMGEPGNVLFFDALTLHGAYTNITPFDRMNLFFCYNHVSNTLNPDGPYHAPGPRPETIASRDPKWMGQALVEEPNLIQ